MSRFDASRRARIAAWTGAALAWGTVVAVAGQRQATAETDTAESGTSIEAQALESGSIPTMPSKGLVIIRHEPTEDNSPPVRTVFVQQAAPAPAAQPAAPAPAPASSGS
jgi:hypothetical protein